MCITISHGSGQQCELGSTGGLLDLDWAYLHIFFPAKLLEFINPIRALSLFELIGQLSSGKDRCQ